MWLGVAYLYNFLTQKTVRRLGCFHHQSPSTDLKKSPFAQEQECVFAFFLLFDGPFPPWALDLYWLLLNGTHRMTNGGILRSLC